MGKGRGGGGAFHATKNFKTLWNGLEDKCYGNCLGMFLENTCIQHPKCQPFNLSLLKIEGGKSNGNGKDNNIY